MTAALLGAGYWASYNVAFFDDVRARLGETQPYDAAPRANLFREMQVRRQRRQPRTRALAHAAQTCFIAGGKPAFGREEEGEHPTHKTALVFRVDPAMITAPRRPPLHILLNLSLRICPGPHPCRSAPLKVCMRICFGGRCGNRAA